MNEEKMDGFEKLIEELQESIDEDARKYYSEKTIQYFTHPINVGRMNDPDGAAILKGVCGDSMEMYLIISENKITKACFYTEDGCGVTVACGSIATKLAEGRSLKDALRISPAEIIEELDGLPAENIHCAILATSTLHKALADYLLRRQI